jgi:predicted flap endonuclease-1-like 5' DNA nuclease
MSGYNPSSSRTSDDTIASFITAELEGSLDHVPGVGPANKRLLNDAGVTTTYQLMGKFLTFRGEV